MKSIKNKVAGLLIFLFLFTIPTTANAFDKNISIENGVRYLKTMQNDDGGFTNRLGTPSNSLLTQWVVMALNAAGEDVNSKIWSKNSNSPLDFILKNTKFEQTTDYARVLLALKAVDYQGLINGINLADEIIKFQKANGQFSQYDKSERDLINAHVWSIFALTGAEREIPKKDKAKNWLLAQQNIDGGFAWAVDGESDLDSTGVALIALVILGEKTASPAIKRAIKYLESQQEIEGGFASDLNKANSASNSWVIQGLVAVGENCEEGYWNKSGGNPYSYLLSLQNKDGSFNWLKDRQVSPVLMTAYAIMALAEKPFPVNIDYQIETTKTVSELKKTSGCFN